jgi:hypothetical protein
MKPRIFGMVGLVVVISGSLAGFTGYDYLKVQGQDAKPQTADPLAALNDSFRASYRQARADLLAKAGPVIVVEGDNLVLVRNGKRTEVKVVPQSYHDLKAIAHIPLAIAMILVPGSEQALTQEKEDQLRRYREVVVAAQSALNQRFQGDVLKRQHVIVRSSLTFVDDALKRHKVAPIDLLNFTVTYEQPITVNAAEAAKAEIDGIHKQLTAWQNDLTAAEWKRLKVVVMGSQMPRRDNVAVQYFAKLLGESGEGKRIIYAESLWDEQKALDLLGTHLLDTWIGSAFFGDDQRMHRDLLGDAAKEYIKELDW